jgi:hypothetical protein
MTKMSLELESEAVRLSENGALHERWRRLLGCSKSAVGNVLVRQAIGLRAPKEWNPSPARLSMAEREEIRVGIERGERFSAIAQLIGRAASTVSRESAVEPGAATIARQWLTGGLGTGRGVPRLRNCAAAYCSTR